MRQVFGMNVTNTDLEYGWESIDSHPGKEMVEYLAARDECEQAWRYYLNGVDEWLKEHDYDSLESARAIAQAAEERKSLLYRQMNCSHEHTSLVDSPMRFSVDGAYEESYVVCDDCRKRI